MTKTLILFLLLFAHFSFSQVQILSELDNRSNYEFYISGSPAIILENGEKRNEFIVSDQSVIQNIIKTWKGKKTNDYLKCGYNYTVYIISENKICEILDINDHCNQLVCSKGSMMIKKNPFAKLKAESKFSSFYFRTDDKNKALVILDLIKNTRDVFCGNCGNYDFSSTEPEIQEDYNLFIFGKPEAISKISNSR